MSEYILQTHDLRKVYGTQAAVAGIDLKVERGAIYGLIGKNGAGKTTTLKMIGGLSAPTAGSFSLFGKSGAELAEVRGRVSCLIEDPGLFGNLSAYENLKAKCLCYGIKGDAYIKKLLEFVGLAETGRKKAKHFSLGMRQRLGIALAMVGEPDLLVLDEPINGLDPEGIVEIRDMLTRVSKEKGITILISSHILEELSKVATHYGIMSKGRLVEQLTAEELADRCSLRIEAVVDRPDYASTVLDGMGISNYKVVDKETIYISERLGDVGYINRELNKAGLLVSKIAVNNESLESFFLNTTAD
ncbi:MAG: ATP-binding cassette domain-containing protein [Lachnospiraceae bacterium]|jgi:ABC-2 type transport system ATP-binding protein|nr:ATP-binding cassette domain-containing protein [Lachnospiraceae bacterium]MCR5530741.1 ATP-binding cassette domain-containing protein [Lachnospiraceae bacterium]